MMEQDGFKNYCVLKTFGVRRSEVQPFFSSGSVSVDFSEDCLDGTILIVNGEGDEVEFQAAVDKLKATGFKPSCSFAEGMAATVAYFQSLKK